MATNASKNPSQKSKIGVPSYLLLSSISAALVGVLVYGGVRRIEEALLWAGGTFIIVLVGIATLALMVKEDTNDPNEPRLK
jgi:hypothetical protein